ncbi:hypothetical protein PR048_033659 [Dryococelus australis]|uniref:Ig-like domain-containing protein n=1 Tax=Dryococelus australis TaxID=614101 RepID=A0ABQ9G0Y2_9NEOP|nr:hypothetical protein PR048_033659 [Dryococelus australis]
MEQRRNARAGNSAIVRRDSHMRKSGIEPVSPKCAVGRRLWLRATIVVSICCQVWLRATIVGIHMLSSLATSHDSWYPYATVKKSNILSRKERSNSSAGVLGIPEIMGVDFKGPNTLEPTALIHLLSCVLQSDHAPPALLYSFIEQTLQPGPAVSLKCSAAGNPTPHISWTLDGFPLPTNGRVVSGVVLTNRTMVSSNTDTLMVHTTPDITLYFIAMVETRKDTEKVGIAEELFNNRKNIRQLIDDTIFPEDRPKPSTKRVWTEEQRRAVGEKMRKSWEGRKKKTNQKELTIFGYTETSLVSGSAFPPTFVLLVLATPTTPTVVCNTYYWLVVSQWSGRHWHAHQMPHRHYARSTKLARKLFVDPFFLWDFKRGDRDMRINSLIASTRKGLYWRAVLLTITRLHETFSEDPVIKGLMHWNHTFAPLNKTTATYTPCLFHPLPCTHHVYLSGPMRIRGRRTSPSVSQPAQDPANTGETGDPRENPPTSGIRSDPAGDRTLFTLLGDEQSNRSATAAPERK